MSSSRRILLINHEYPPLSASGGQATAHIAHEIARMGHQPFVLTAAWGNQPRITCEDGITVHRIPALRGDVEHFSVMQMIAFACMAMLAAPGLVRQWKPDAAIVFCGLPNGPIGWLLKRLYKLPYVIALQGADVPGFGTSTFETWYQYAVGFLRRIWANADAVIANSDSLAVLAHRCAPDQPIDVIPTGADVAGISGKEAYASRGPLRLLYVGRLVREKGLDVLIRALAKLPPDLSWRLILGGDGPEWTTLAGLAARHNIADRVQVRGWVDRTELTKVFHDADIFVLPSRTNGSPGTLMEAMAAGLPVIGTHVHGTEDMVVEGTTALLVSPEDADALAKAIMSLAKDADQRAALGQAGRKRAEIYFSWTAIAATWLDLIARIAKPK